MQNRVLCSMYNGLYVCPLNARAGTVFSPKNTLSSDTTALRKSS